jgi:Dolichyl-phosphate-mannose-protein mannosyltransferase
VEFLEIPSAISIRSLVLYLGSNLEQRAAACERFLYKHRFPILAILTVLYFFLTILRAWGKSFWYDEILTILEARQPTLSASLNAARDVDWMPPLSHVEFYLTDKLLGDGEIAFRLGPMLGFWVFCLCLYAFVAHRASIAFAFVALLLPFATLFSAYSFEARSYALELGFCGIALLAWQAAADGRHRPLALIALFVGLAGALLNHYWAVFIYLPLGTAEAWRNFQRRQIDWPIWIAFAAGAVPLLISLLQVLRVVQNNLHPWSSAHPRDYFIFYSNFWPMIGFVLPFLILFGAWLLLKGPREQPAGLPPSTVRNYELLAAGLFLVIPIVAITCAIAIPPHIYVARYLALSTAGLALLTAFAAAQWAKQRAAIAILCAIAALAPFLFHFTQIRRHPARNPFLGARVLRKALQAQPEPVVVSNYISFLELWYYAPDPIKPRLLCLNDQQSAIKYRHMDDVAGTSLRSIGVPFYSYRDFATPGKQFLIYYIGWSWMTKKVLEDGGTLDPMPGNPKGMILRAHIK